MRNILKALLTSATLAASLSGCVGDGMNDRPGYASGYDYNHADPRYGGYDADRYYRANGRHQDERALSQDERVYRGRDGRYYCRQSDGSTGLIVGAITGGILGNIIAPGGSEVLGTVLGAGAGAVAGQAIDRDNVRCR